MKRILALTLVLFICLGCVGCSSSSDGANPASQEAVKLSKNIQMYVPGATIETDFGSVTVMDAAFTAKAQIYYTKSSITRKSTVNGQTTESYEETIHPGYISTMENKLVFALKTVMTNTTGEDIEIHKLTAKANFMGNSPVYFSKGGNFHISDEAYKILPAGGSSEIILAALVPVEQYLLATECLLEIGGAELGFTYDNINIYNVLGFQEGDNTTVTIDEVIQAAQNSASSKPVETEPATEPEETEPPIQMFPGTNKKDGSSAAEGRAVKIENVSVGFRDQLPIHIQNDRSTSYQLDELTLNETQVYSVINFTATNLTTETIDLADIDDDFLVQLTYGSGYQYSTNTDVYALFESGANIKRVRRNGTGGNDISVSPLASAEVTVYIPCARKVAEDYEGALSVTFIAKYSGNESLVFDVSRTAPAEVTPVSNSGSETVCADEYFWVDDTEGSDVNVLDHSAETLDNGDVRLSITFQAPEGMGVYMFGIPSKGVQWTDLFTRDERTTGDVESCTVTVQKATMEELDGVYFACYRDGDDYAYGGYLYKNNLKTAGTPTGTVKDLQYGIDGQATVYSATAQLLDNGYVRYTVEFTAPAGRFISFFDPPNGDRFMRVRYLKTTGQREILEVDIPLEDNNAISAITMKFYDGYSDEGDWAFLTPVWF